ncbi:MAG: DUF2073 domain-containing protein [Candidatus Woesearchaeota archaeon]|nr:DUF2073 domain-containing protein [Candidatus Woesearchaeota archaeon]
MLKLQFVPYADIEHLDTSDRIDKLLGIVKGNKIVLMQGRLHPEEEGQLIQETMQQIEDSFRGIEICTIYPEEKNLQLLKRVKKEMVKYIIGNRDGITIIGPATIVREIKRDPNNMMLLTMHTTTPRTRSASKKTPSRSKKRR